MKRAAGSSLAMQVRRAGRGAPLVLVGGGLTGWASWEPHQRQLAGSRDVARAQLLSVQYGLDGRPLPADYSVVLEAGALAAALDGLGWTEPLDLVGWSYGGMVSLELALGAPHRVRTLTLIEPPAFWVLGGEADEAGEEGELARLLRSLRGDITEAQLEQWTRAVGLVPPGVDAGTLPQWPVWLRHRHSLRACAAPLEHRDDVRRLEEFTRPVLLVTGTGTPRWLRRITELLAVHLPDARTVEMPAGHAPQLASMERFLGELAAFHAETSPR